MRNFITVKYREKKFGDKYFLTNDSGRYCVLTDKEYDLFRKDCFTAASEKKLVDSYMIVDASNMVQSLELLNERNNAIFAGTSLHIIVVTLLCNMNCQYCQVGRKYCDRGAEYDMDKETAKHTVDRIFETPNNNITIEFQGGEPTLNWDVMKFIIEYAETKNKEAEKEMGFSVVSNMTTMTDERMKYLIDHNVNICTSLDGPAKVHNVNRAYKEDNHAQVVKWIKKFNDEYKKRRMTERISALPTLTRHSLKYMKEIIDEYVKNDVEVIHLRKLTKLGFAKAAWDKISYSADEYLDFWHKGVEYIEKLKLEGKFINSRMVMMVEEKIREDKDIDYMDWRSPCGFGIGQIVYDYDGLVYGCDESRMFANKSKGVDDVFCLGNVKDNYYEDFTKNSKCFDCVVASTITKYECCDNCVYSPFCGNCPVLNYADKGTMDINPEDTAMCKCSMFIFDFIVKKYFL